MIYLFLSVLCSVLIANLLMLFNLRGRIGMLPVFLGNYLIASLFSWMSVPGGRISLSGFDFGLAIVAGSLFLGNFWVYQRSIAVNGLSLSVGVMRVAMIIPVLISVAVFGERLSAWNAAGIALGIGAFALKADPKELRNLLWIIGLFLVSGATDATLKVYKELGSGAESSFILMIFASAFVFTLGAIILGKIPLTLKSFLLGCLLGFPNRWSTVFFLKGLDHVPAALAYPLVAVSIMALSIFSDLALWKRKASRRDILLWALLAMSLVLLNLR